MKIVVFTDQQPTASDSALVSKFENANYRVLVDSVHKHEIDWIVNNYASCPNRVYFADSDELYDGNVKELDHNAPFSFIAYFTVGTNLNNADWVYIRLYLKALLYDHKMPRLTRRLTSMLNEVYTETVTVDAACEDIVNDNDMVNEPCYTFKKAIFEDRNIALCEIVKPIIVKCQDKHQEKVLVEPSIPYTIVIRNFASRGYYPVFWSLFICDSWGKDNKDIQFLKALWSDLKMDGDFDMDKIMENGVNECNWSNGEGACAGPEVYRKGIAETLDTLLTKEKGFGAK